MWEGKGHVSADQMNPARAMYLAGYVTKKWSKDDPDIAHPLDGRHPEFSSMSKRPPIGAQAFTDYLTTNEGAAAMAEIGLIPRQIRIGGKLFPADRTIRKFASEAIGVPYKHDDELDTLPPLDYHEATALETIALARKKRASQRKHRATAF